MVRFQINKGESAVWPAIVSERRRAAMPSPMIPIPMNPMTGMIAVFAAVELVSVKCQVMGCYYFLRKDLRSSRDGT